MQSRKIIVVGGGAAGFFAAITCAEAMPDAEVTVLEQADHFLGKVRISGGGRCNVTHACFDAREFAAHYPRGEQELIGPLERFGARDTVAWFKKRGVTLNTLCDGCIFPLSDTSQTIIDCFLNAAQAAGVTLRTNCSVERIEDRFKLTLSTGETLSCDRLLLATGGCRTAAAGQLAVSLGHTLEPPVPSLFTFQLDTPWLRELAGIVVESVEASAQGLRERGTLLVTHEGLSGPVILRLSAWGARTLHDCDYKFPLVINWLPHLPVEEVATELQWRRSQQPGRLVVNTPIAPLPARLWEQLVLAAGIGRDTRWAVLPRAAMHRLTQQLIHTELSVTGKSVNKEEFVTCGGVRLREVNFRTMESRIRPGLYFAGELLDIDGLTGGFNFQAAWTTGWIAGQAMGRLR
ncbi:MAG: NAD(P)/FAD-dependent oxidoreductase [Verrucomicrobia bacterium]|nr:NAD(P)/FAD-dependent oxidoreductase [Verrucomicrobiota bacterium]